MKPAKSGDLMQVTEKRNQFKREMKGGRTATREVT
jgi:hypothetical protein